MATKSYNTITVTRQTTGPLPDIPFARICQDILGPHYMLDVVFVGLAKAKELHQQWKGKKTPVNVFAFPYDDSTGEIIISLAAARKHAPAFGHSYPEHVLYLFIHGVLHLAGHDHGDEMERLEARAMKKYHR